MAEQNKVTAERLKSFIERIERLEEEKAGIAADIKEIYSEARGSGFDTKTMREIIRLRKMSDQERAERESLLDIYKAALGMLADTPLGAAALRRLSKKEASEETSSNKFDPLEDPLADDPAPADEHAGLTVEDARQMGEDAAKEGKPVTANPFRARDRRRAAWDEAWCQAAGSDGMEIPKEWQPTKRKKSKKGDNNDA